MPLSAPPISITGVWGRTAMMSEAAIVESVTSNRERSSAKTIENRLRWGVTAEERAVIRSALMRAIEHGRDMPDGSVRKPGPRTLVTLARCMAELNRQDQADVHHLEGQKVNLTATISKPADEEAADLLAEMRRRDMTPRAN